MTTTALTPSEPGCGARPDPDRRAVGRRAVGVRARGDRRGRGLRQDHLDGGPRRLAGRQRLRPPRPGARAHLHHEGDGAAAVLDEVVRQRARRRGHRRWRDGRGRSDRRAPGPDLPRLLGAHPGRARHPPRSRAAPDDAHRRRAPAARLPGRLPVVAAARRDRAVTAPGHQGPAQPRRRADRARGVAGRPARVRRRHGRDAAVLRAAAEDRHRDGDHLRPARPPGGPRHGVACGQGRARRARLRRPDPAGRRDRPARSPTSSPTCVRATRVVLLDEYQDTSIAQRVLLQRIFGEGHPVMAVGDPCQAIYGWRGASVDNIEDFPEHFPAGGRRRRGAFHAVPEPALRREHPRGRQPHVGAPAHGACRRRAARPQARTARARGPCPARSSRRTRRRSSGSSGRSRPPTPRAAPGGRSPGATSRCWRPRAPTWSPSTRRSRRRGIPTQLVGAAALMAQPAVIDLRSMLELVHDPSANPAFVRLAVGPRWRIGARDLAALGDRAAQLAGGRHRSGQDDIGSALDDAVAGTDVVESISLTEALDDLGDLDRYSARGGRAVRARWPGELRDLRGHVGEPLPEFVLRVMRATGLEVEAALGSPECRGPAAARPACLPRSRRRLHRARRPAHPRGVPGAAARRGALRHRPRAGGDRPRGRGAAADRPQGQGSGVRLRLRAVRGVGGVPRRSRPVAVAHQRQHGAVAAAR